MASKYYFHLFRENLTSDDQVGRVCDDLLLAFQHAMQIVSELSVYKEDWGTVVEVCDSGGNAISWFCSGETVIATSAGELSRLTTTLRPSVEIGRNSLETIVEA